MRFTIGIIFSAFFLFLSGHAQDTTFVKKTQNSKNPVVLNKNPEALGISERVQKSVATMTNPPVNIALFGIDRRSPDDLSNSDVIMIISLDKKNGKIKMSSIMRDTYVKIDGVGMNKINSAFAIGGPQLAIKTLNENFDMDIKDYLNVDFYSAAKIIDGLGGVNILVKPAELTYLNNYLDELANINNTTAEHVQNAGLQKLNGKQAVAYTRIRYAGNGDYERTERQRSVLIALFNQIKSAGESMFPIFAAQILPNLETSMSNMSMLTFASNILAAKDKTIEQARFPLDSQSTGKKINNVWYITTDLKRTTNSIHNFIYKNIRPL